MKLFPPVVPMAPVAFVAGWLLLTPGLQQAPAPAPAPAAQKPAAPAPADPKPAGEVATHATKGVVKTVSATSVVITHQSAGKQSETSFVLTSSTQRVGAVAAGATVEIRYITKGKQRIATAVSVQASTP